MHIKSLSRLTDGLPFSNRPLFVKRGVEEGTAGMQLDWVKRTSQKATPLLVHLLMIGSVGLYAVLGAVIMRKLETRDDAAREKRAAAEVMRSRKCVITILKQLRGKCDITSVDARTIKELDKCYHVAVEHNTHTKDVIFTNSAEQVESVAEELEEVLPWSFMDSLLFAFTVITTIGKFRFFK
ncbi:unnamed protein product, partial [Mesorhabditis spiculigera]